MRVKKQGFGRRRKSLTNYRKRLAMIKGGLDRVVVRKSNRRIIGQILRYNESGDIVLVHADSGELSKMGWIAKSNRPTAYLTGLLLAKKAKEKGEASKEHVLDIGLSRPIKNSIPFVFAKGCVDNGLKIRGNFNVEKGFYDASKITKYANDLKAKDMLNNQFSSYMKAGIVDKLSELFESTAKKLMSG